MLQATGDWRICEVAERISTKLGQIFIFDCYLKNLVRTPLTRQLTLMSHQFSTIRHSSYYLYRDVIYLDYPADELVVSTLISLSSLY